MDCHFYFGPDKIPFRLLDNSTVEAQSTVPFHGIISRGLLQGFIDLNLSHHTWLKFAGQISEASSNKLSIELEKIIENAKKCEVLSFEESSYVVKKYVGQYCEIKKLKNPQIEIWNIKEGHTSSVWCVTIVISSYRNAFVVNVARDREGGRELLRSSEKLLTLTKKCPDLNIAKVYDIQTILDSRLPGKVIVTRNEWIENSSEIHSRSNKQTSKDEFLLVERFLTDANSPAQIRSILGRVFTPQEELKIKKGINEFNTKATAFLPDKIQININDGDVVWNGEKAIVVAIS